MISGYSFDISSSKSPKLVNYIFFILFCVEFQTYYIQDSKNLHVDLFFVCVEPMFTNGVSAVVTLYEIWSFMHDIIDYCFYEIK